MALYIKHHYRLCSQVQFAEISVDHAESLLLSQIYKVFLESSCHNYTSTGWIYFEISIICINFLTLMFRQLLISAVL